MGELLLLLLLLLSDILSGGKRRAFEVGVEVGSIAADTGSIPAGANAFSSLRVKEEWAKAA